MVFLGVLMCVLLTACAASPQDAPRLRYLCQHGQQFEARLYEDAALLDGQNAQQQLARVTEDGGAFFVASAGKVLGAGAPSNRIRLCVMGCSRTAFDGTRFSMNPKGARGRGYQVMCRVCEMKDAEIAAARDAAVAEAVRQFGAVQRA